jgi:hypothetical protein
MFDFVGMPPYLKAILALIVVVVLIAVAAWIVRRLASTRLGGAGLRGRQPRLAVIDAANVDARRRLVLIRRDNIEHLLMIGGPSDLVIEPNIVRATGVREAGRDLARENGARGGASDESWPLQPLNEPPVRARVSSEQVGGVPDSTARARSSDVFGSADLAARLSGPDIAPSPRAEPRAMPAPASKSKDVAGDHNLSEVANQLEAALRRMPETRAPEPAPVKPVEPPRAPRDIKMRIDPRIGAEPKAENRIEPRIEPKLEPKADSKFEPRVEAKDEPKLEPKLDNRPPPPEPKVEPRVEARPEPKPEPKSDALSRQDFYDNLEEEMASLLGRPPGKS